MSQNNTMKEQLLKLEEKYQVMGQDIHSYLDGLLVSNYLTYWDYTQVDTLLSLQNPRTDFPDEQIFIIYHQATELYFKLCLHELSQIGNNGRAIRENGQDQGWKKKLDVDFFIARMQRMNRYFELLTKSFSVMGEGMEPEQFLKYRMALLPASGFQSAQYRMIEICSTDLVNLVSKDKKESFKKNKKASIEDLFEHIYWKEGATELASGQKTLTLKQFEKKYSDRLIQLAKENKDKNLLAKYRSLSAKDQKNPALVNTLKEFDMNVNVHWPLVHYQTAARYLGQKKSESDIKATGGTNWQKYLPPRFQRRVFYPDFWTKSELESWGTHTK